FAASRRPASTSTLFPYTTLFRSNAILVSGAIVALTVLINKLIPDEALQILMSLVVSSLIINWTMISLTHIIFRKHKRKAGIKTRSEEHTSELQSRENLVCRLLLE